QSQGHSLNLCAMYAGETQFEILRAIFTEMVNKSASADVGSRPGDAGPHYISSREEIGDLRDGARCRRITRQIAMQRAMQQDSGSPFKRAWFLEDAKPKGFMKQHLTPAKIHQSFRASLPLAVYN